MSTVSAVAEMKWQQPQQPNIRNFAQKYIVFHHFFVVEMVPSSGVLHSGGVLPPENSESTSGVTGTVRAVDAIDDDAKWSSVFFVLRKHVARVLCEDQTTDVNKYIEQISISVPA